MKRITKKLLSLGLVSLLCLSATPSFAAVGDYYEATKGVEYPLPAQLKELIADAKDNSDNHKFYEELADGNYVDVAARQNETVKAVKKLLKDAGVDLKDKAAVKKYFKDHKAELKKAVEDAEKAAPKLSAAELKKLKVASVSAINSTVVAGKDGQFLQFTVNKETEPFDLKKLEGTDYKVEFKASKKILKDQFGNAALRNATGELKKEALVNGDSFDFEVIITLKDEIVAKSELAKVEVVGASNVVEITEVGVKARIDGVANVKLGSTLSLVSDSNVQLFDVKGTTQDGKTNQAVPAPTFKSLNKGVALIAADGKITMIQAGDAQFEVASGKAKKVVDLKIVDEARKVSVLTADPTEVNISNTHAGFDVKLMAKDQFGDPAIVDLAKPADAKADDVTIATANDPAKTAKDGGTTLRVIPASGESGVSAFSIIYGDKVLSLPVTVSDEVEVTSRKLETSDEPKLDVYKPADTIKFFFNKYAGASLIGPEKDIATDDSKTYKLTADKVNGENVVTLNVNPGTGEITVTAAKEGITTLRVMEGALEKASATVTVENSGPKVTNVDFNKNAKITQSAAYPLSNVIKSVKDASSETLHISDTGKIYDTAMNAATDDDSTGKVGTIDMKSDLGVMSVDSGNIKIDGADPKAGMNGNIVILVKDIDGKVAGQFVLPVAVPVSFTDITVTPVNVPVGNAGTPNTKVAGLAKVGGGGAVTFTLVEATSEGVTFKISGTELQIDNGTVVNAQKYTVKIRVEDNTNSLDFLEKTVTFTAQVS